MYETMSMKDAVKRWENENKQKIATATEIKLTGVCPSLEKMDTVMLSFVSCEKLSLSSNCIERITNLGNMKNLKILSLGRNNIKSISGIEACGETLEELWISYNQIDKLKGIGTMKKLRVLTMSNNHVREWVEFQRLAEVTTLRELVFIGNPLEERCSSEGIWRSEVARRLPGLAKLDGHQCMIEAEVNLNDTQTELQKSSPSPIEDDEKADESNQLGDEEEGSDVGFEEDDNENCEEQVIEREVKKETSTTDSCDRNNEPKKILEEEENLFQTEQENTNVNIHLSNNFIDVDTVQIQGGPHRSEE